MTEEQAKTKWCPMVRAASNAVPAMRYGDLDITKARHPDEACCIGSGCMMWRWDGWPEGAKAENQQGHCGLAGNDKTATSI